jgi:hypothetical protein
MASGESDVYGIPFPIGTDPVNVHQDIKQLVQNLELLLPNVSYSQIRVFNNTSSLIGAKSPVYVTGYENNATTVGPAVAITTQPILGLAKDDIPINGHGIVVVSGILSDVNTSSYLAGTILYVGEQGGVTSTRPSSSASAAVGVVGFSSSIKGIIIVEAKGNGSWGALKAGLA